MNKTNIARVLCFLLIFLIIILKVLHPVYLASLQVVAITTFQDFSNKYHLTEEIHTSITDNDVFYKVDVLPNSGIHAFAPTVAPHTKPLRILIICGQHGRELVTSEVCFALISLLQGKINTLEYIGLSQELRMMGVAFYIMPVINIHSRHMAYSGIDPCSRLNANNVDLNRNFPSMFKKPRQLPPLGSEEYGGPMPLSENESMDIDQYMHQVRPHVILNVHSGGNAVLTPYDADVLEQPPNYKHMVHILNKIRSSHSELFDFKVGPSSLLYYSSYGTLMDYGLTFKEVDIGLTLEIFSNASHSDCRGFYNPEEGIELSSTIEKWTYFILLFAKKLFKSIIIINPPSSSP